jgi:hypothetical protein
LIFCDVTQHRLVVTDVSGQHIGPIKDCLTLKDVNYSFCRNDDNYQSTLRDIRQERRFIHTAAEAWNRATFDLPLPILVPRIPVDKITGLRLVFPIRQCLCRTDIRHNCESVCVVYTYTLTVVSSVKSQVTVYQNKRPHTSAKSLPTDHSVGRDSSVRIAALYGLDGPGIESRWRRDFPQTSRPALGPTQPLVQWAPGVFPGAKAAEGWRWPTHPHLAPRLKKG